MPTWGCKEWKVDSPLHHKNNLQESCSHSARLVAKEQQCRAYSSPQGKSSHNPANCSALSPALGILRKIWWILSTAKAVRSRAPYTNLDGKGKKKKAFSVEARYLQVLHSILVFKDPRGKCVVGYLNITTLGAICWESVGDWCCVSLQPVPVFTSPNCWSKKTNLLTK